MKHPAMNPYLPLWEYVPDGEPRIGRLGGASQKAFVAVVRGVVLLDEVADIDFLFPDAALKAFPLFEIDHWNLLAPFHARVSAF